MNSLEKTRRVITSIRGGHVLDVASGAGEFIDTIREFRDVELITALDRSLLSRKFIFNKHPDVQFVLGDAANMPFENNFFDTACISNSLHHMPDIQSVLREMLRVLRPGGVLVVNEMHRDAYDEVSMNHVLLHHWAAAIDRKSGRYHDETFTRTKLERLVESIGLEELIESEYEWPIEDPRAKDIIEPKIKGIENALARLSGKNGFDELIKMGETIKCSIIEKGYAPAPYLFFKGIKPKGKS